MYNYRHNVVLQYMIFFYRASINGINDHCRAACIHDFGSGGQIGQMKNLGGKAPLQCSIIIRALNPGAPQTRGSD